MPSCNPHAGLTRLVAHPGETAKSSPGMAHGQPNNTQCTPALLHQEGSTATTTHPGLLPPTLIATGHPVVGAKQKHYHVEMKAQCIHQLATQEPKTHWTTHTGIMFTPTPNMGNTCPNATSYRNSMCPSNQVASHPAYPLLAEWSQLGCPTMTGKHWSQA